MEQRKMYLTLSDIDKNKIKNKHNNDCERHVGIGVSCFVFIR